MSSSNFSAAQTARPATAASALRNNQRAGGHFLYSAPAARMACAPAARMAYVFYEYT